VANRARRLPGILNVTLPLDFEQLARQAALFFQDGIFVLLPALFRNHHVSIISYDSFDSRLWTAKGDSLHSLLAESDSLSGGTLPEWHVSEVGF
jgi:hypothetical protein